MAAWRREGKLTRVTTYYIWNVCNTLLPRSLTGAKTAAEAAKEWEWFPNHTRYSSDFCQLCGHTGYQYGHIIRHRVTGEVLLIGSQCSSNFWAMDIIRYQMKFLQTRAALPPRPVILTRKMQPTA